MIVKCVECNKKFSKASNLYRHRREQHGANEESYCVTCDKYFKRKEHYLTHMNAIHLFKNKNVCSLCDYSTFTKSAMLRHEKLVHKNPYSEFNMRRNDPRFTCSLCSKKFSSKRSLDNHQQKKHGLLTSNLRVKRICPLCAHSVLHCSGGKANKIMYDHFFQKHGIYLDIDFLESENLIAFHNWKANIEITTSSKFNRSNRKAKKCFRFSCYRSGVFSPKGSGKRVSRTIESCKINAFCPAAIIAVLKENGKVQITFIKTHVGHKNDTLTKTSKKKIQLKIKGIRNRHKASLSIGSENVFFQSDGEWQVPSSKGDCYFGVEKIQSSICKNCNMKCYHCNACFHQYTCTCIDYTKKSNMCKHIHLVAKFSGDQEAVFVNEDDLLVVNESCDENLVVVDIPQEEKIREEREEEELEDDREPEGTEAEELDLINVYSPSNDDEVDDQIQKLFDDPTVVDNFILSHVEIAKPTSPSSPPPTHLLPPPPSHQMFVEAKERFTEQLLTTLQDKITNFQQLEAVQNHWKCMDSILNSLPSNSSHVDTVSQRSMQQVPPEEIVSYQTSSSPTITNTRKYNSHSTKRKEIICVKIIPPSKYDEKSLNFL
ncbi:uncharacterized protein LOC111049838 isoform X1 [Nilaparvata lugens]|uniref:uncharacterized protein LOC111049838 isoform X1 n=1 Tax=Nilaparvata lugens TaxID=108931 RepID=UPI00193E8402|nr:uncharacterized protein LOC111049838 isoform X1 [Nilaparvata lugens]